MPKQIIEQGLKEEQLFISANTILDIVRYYTREAGVRNLERQISAICRMVTPAEGPSLGTAPSGT